MKTVERDLLYTQQLSNANIQISILKEKIRVLKDALTWTLQQLEKDNLDKTDELYVDKIKRCLDLIKS